MISLLNNSMDNSPVVHALNYLMAGIWSIIDLTEFGSEPLYHL
jgi:hypothetical protein